MHKTGPRAEIEVKRDRRKEDEREANPQKDNPS